jgi:hypothetical protein
MIFCKGRRISSNGCLLIGANDGWILELTEEGEGQEDEDAAEDDGDEEPTQIEEDDGKKSALALTMSLVLGLVVHTK